MGNGRHQSKFISVNGDLVSIIVNICDSID